MDTDGPLSAHRKRPLCLYVAFVCAIVEGAAADEKNMSKHGKGYGRVSIPFCNCLYNPGDSLESGPGISCI